MSAWLLPCNPKYYDIEGVYNNLVLVDWKQSLRKVCVGDYAYIYVSCSVRAIKYKCVVEEINKSESTIDDKRFYINSESYANYGKYMTLRFICEYSDDKFTYKELIKNGLNGKVQRQISIPEKLERYINSID